MCGKRLVKSFVQSVFAGPVLIGPVLLFLIGCSNVTQSNDVINNNAASNENGSSMKEAQKPPAKIEVDPRLVAANTSFGFKLLAEVFKQSQGRNVFISPSSVATALAMTYNGAEGETRRAMAAVLGVQGMGLDEINRAYSQLQAALTNPDPKVQLQIANSLWAKEGIGFAKQFVERNGSYYGAEVRSLNFADPAATSTINDWVRAKTGGKIEKIIDQINREALLYLLNAIYFKGKWSKEFDKAQTKEDAFTLADARQKRVPMMTQSGSYGYLEDKLFQAVSLPYGEGGVSMYIFLPAKDSNLARFQQALTAESWNDWMERFQDTPGHITLPRFKVEYEIELNGPLKAMGMAAAFDPDRADFSGMFQTPRGAFISNVRHKTFAEVNEEGTEAAAVTSVEVMPTSVARPRQSFQMVVDRPFFCAIRDNRTATVLFIGSVVDPQAQ